LLAAGVNVNAAAAAAAAEGGFRSGTSISATICVFLTNQTTTLKQKSLP